MGDYGGGDVEVLYDGGGETMTQIECPRGFFCKVCANSNAIDDMTTSLWACLGRNIHVKRFGPAFSQQDKEDTSKDSLTRCKH